MDIDARGTFLTTLVASPEGRQHVLSRSVDAEEADEGGVFEQLAASVEDPELRKIVERHRDDEVRHARLFRDCLDRLGLVKQVIPEELRVVPRIVAGIYGGEHVPRGFRTTQDVVATFAVLHAIERRGVEQFPIVASAFEAVDAETADVYQRVTRDERRHVRYCERIGRHLAANDEQWDEMVDVMRRLEGTAFAAVSLDDLQYCVQQGWVDASVP